MSAAAYQAVGVGHATSVAWPAHAAGDTGYLVVQTSSAAGGALTTPGGWTPVDGFPLLLTRGLYVFKLRATSGAMGNAGLAGSGNFWGVIFTVRNGHQVFPTQCSGRNPTTTSSNSNCPGVNSAVDDVLVATILAINSVTTGGLVSAQANATLAAYAERYDDGSGTTAGATCICTGDLAGAGPIDASTSTVTSSGSHRATLVINPAADISITGAVTIDGVAAANSAGGNPKVYLYDLTQPAANNLVVDAATETNAFSLISGGAGGFAFKVPFNDHEYIAVYKDETGAIYGASQKLTFGGGAFPAAVITIKTISASGATLIASNYEGDFSVRKNEPNADDRVAGPMPFYDNSGTLLTGQTFSHAAHEVQIWNADTGTFADANADTTEAASKGLYGLQMTQAETNHTGGYLIVKLAKATYADQFFAVPLRAWQKTDSDSIATILAAVDTEIASILAAVDTEVAAILAAVDTEVAAIKAKTDQLTFTVANKVDSQVRGMDTDVVTAAAIATDAIGSAELAASAVTEIQSGLATSSALSTAQTDITTIKNAVDTEVAAILAAVDTEIGAIIATLADLPDDIDTLLSANHGAGDWDAVGGGGGGGGSAGRDLNFDFCG